MSEARALTNFAGNSIACVLIGTWTRTIDRTQVDLVLSGQAPFDERMLSVGTDHPVPPSDAAKELQPAR